MSCCYYVFFFFCAFSSFCKSFCLHCISVWFFCGACCKYPFDCPPCISFGASCKSFCASCKFCFNSTLSQTTKFTPFQIKKISRTTILSFDENGGKFSNSVENTVGKGEIARYEQFLLFPQCFQKTFTALVWERVKSISALCRPLYSCCGASCRSYCFPCRLLLLLL